MEVYDTFGRTMAHRWVWDDDGPTWTAGWNQCTNPVDEFSDSFRARKESWAWDTSSLRLFGAQDSIVPVALCAPISSLARWIYCSHQCYLQVILFRSNDQKDEINLGMQRHSKTNRCKNDRRKSGWWVAPRSFWTGPWDRDRLRKFVEIVQNSTEK